MGSASAESTTKNITTSDKKFTTVTIPFTENNGQIKNKTVKFTANTFIGNVYVKDNGIVYKLTKGNKTWVVTETFKYANTVTAKGIVPSKTKVSYYIGDNPKNWEKNLSTYQQILYSNLYTGVDLRLKAHGKNIEKVYTIGSTGSVSSIWVSVSGSKGLKINKNGQLEILNKLGNLELTKPIAYQIINGKRVNVSVSYVLNGTSYGYKTGAYNKKYNLIIDPLLSSTYLGGNSYDGANAIAVDKDGYVYVTGYTGSYDFPAYTGLYNSGAPTGECDVFVSKFNNDLSYFKSGVVFGGSGTSYANAIAIDQQNFIYITGATNAADFPAITLKNVYPNNGLQTNKGDYDTFVVKLSSQYLENIEWLALLGGLKRDIGNGITVDQTGRVYIVGGTWSNDFKYMTSSSSHGMEDAFITIMDKQLQNVLYSVYIGGKGIDVANGIAISFLGQNIAVIGTTNSTKDNPNTFPNVTNELPSYPTFEDVFLVGFKNFWSQRTLDTTILGGANADYGQAVTMDNSGNVYMAGNTWSNDYPTTIDAFNSVKNDNIQYVKDAFVSKIDNLVDTEPPVVTSTDPIKNSSNIALNKVIKIIYNEQIQKGIDYGGIILSNSGGNVPITTSISEIP